MAGAGAGRVHLEQQVAVLGGQRQERVEEGCQALPRRRARPQRRGAAQELLLQLALGLVDQRLREPGPVAEAVEDRALGHTRRAGDVAHRHRLDAALGEQLPRGLEHAPAVAGGVGAFARPGLSAFSMRRP